MYQYGTQHQSTLQDLSSGAQYQDPNQSMYQYGTIYQPALQDVTAIPQYQDPNQSMYQYGTQTSLETSYSTDASWSYPIHNDNIHLQQESPSVVPIQTSATVPIQTSATNLSPNSFSQNSPLSYGSGNPSYPYTYYPNLVPNTFDVQTSVENPSSTSMSHYSPCTYGTVETANQIWTEDPSQDSNAYQRFGTMNNPEIVDTNSYPVWSAASCDPCEETAINKR
ncbi:hypothetical protein HNY73_007285 [Argiope bruennichi]|uniref:Uncharacterized protein n=1 Tax=Argiope bruennichi TaxID=94029 RepID=A0A8T0FDH5_ARGBR|nr:hypothetical protein HNY73_007285 [Argiope bruennichi]